MAFELQKEPEHDVATRTGEFAMLLYSIGECQIMLENRVES